MWRVCALPPPLRSSLHLSPMWTLLLVPACVNVQMGRLGQDSQKLLQSAHVKEAGVLVSRVCVCVHARVHSGPLCLASPSCTGACVYVRPSIVTPPEPLSHSLIKMSSRAGLRFRLWNSAGWKQAASMLSSWKRTFGLENLPVQQQSSSVQTGSENNVKIQTSLKRECNWFRVCVIITYPVSTATLMK